MDVNECLGKLKWESFLKHFESNLSKKIKDSPESVYKKLGGKLPKKDKGGR